MSEFLTQQQVIDLRLAHKQQKEKRLADRIKAILALNEGFSYSHIAKILLFDEVTIRRYVDKFLQLGINGLLEYHYTGGKSNLTLIQEQELKSYFQIHTPRTAKEAVDHIFNQYQIKYSIIGVTKLLHRLGFVYKKPKVIPGKADRLKQELFLKEYEKLKNELKSNDRIYFADSTHPTHNTQLAYGWILKGKANDKYIKTNTGRDRLNLNGVLDFNRKTAIVLEEKTIDSQATINLLETVRFKQPNGKVYIIVDNASHHHSKRVGNWLLRHRRFKLIFLPSYSPNLNLIERLWRFFHQHVTANHYFETFNEFRQTSLNFFNNLNLYQKELSTLLTDNFQLVPLMELQT